MEDKIARIFTPPPKFRFKILKGENLGGESLRSDFKNVATSVLLESICLMKIIVKYSKNGLKFYEALTMRS